MTDAGLFACFALLAVVAATVLIDSEPFDY